MRVLVAMSGGVDSAVAALLCQRQGHEVIGMTLRMHDDPERLKRAKSCCAPRDMGDARQVAQKLNIPYYAIDMREDFHERVMKPFALSYLKGQTPNPCVLCNKDLKFGLLYQRAKALGCEKIATGHYARLLTQTSQDDLRLFRGKDERKDQSYFLFGLNQSQLKHTLFPLGNLDKQEVRDLARQAGLPIADKAESQEICFVPDNRYAKVVEKMLPDEISKKGQGKIIHENGETLGEHQGIHYFTVGQRKGLAISYSHPLYVCRIDAEENIVVVGPESSLGCRRFKVRGVNWIAPPWEKTGQDKTEGFEAEVKIRYGHLPSKAKVNLLAPSQVEVSFDEPQKAVAPGQAAVFYHGDEVLGGGWIHFS